MTRLSDPIARMLDDAKLPGIEVSPVSWFDFWHTHADWDGIGNTSVAARSASLSALFLKFAAILGELEKLPIPFQVWACVCPNSADDSICVHSPNPKSAFPYPFAGVAWGSEVPSFLAQHVAGRPFRVGQSSSESGPIYWVEYVAGEI